MWHSLPGTHVHVLLEMVAYLIAGRLYLSAARNQPQPALGDRLILLGAALLGALTGSKLLHAAQHLPFLLARDEMALWLGGKSLLGGLLGGTWGVELAKRAVGWSRPTGDAWVLALAVGIALGRLGCQLSGTWDQTYGTPTTLVWAWDYGDGIGRHPTALYEILVVALVAVAVRRAALSRAPGASFAAFLLLYCLARFGLEWLKPPFGAAAADALPTASYGGMTAIQWAAVLGMLWYAALLRIRLHTTPR